MSKSHILSIHVYIDDSLRILKVDNPCCDDYFNKEFLELFHSMREIVESGLPPIDFLRKSESEEH